MINQFILTIKTKKTNKGWDKEKPGMVFDREFLLLIILAVVNFIFEYYIRYFVTSEKSNIFIQALHILVFFSPPAFIFLSSPKKSIAFLASIYIVTIPTYLLILQNPSKFYLSFFLMANWIIYWIFFKKENPQIKRLVSLSGKKNILLGLLCAMLFASHMLLVFYLADNILISKIDWSWVYLNFFLEIGFSLIGMEFFFRYFLFLRLIEKNNFSFSPAYFVSTLLFSMPFFANPVFTSSAAVFVGSIYYIFMHGFIACLLTRHAKNLMPAFFFSLIISVLISAVLGR